MNTFNLTLDLNKSRAANPVRIRQGDVQGTTITALILDHGATADLTGYTAQFVMDLPDGTHYYRKAASISGNTVTVTIDETQAASVTGCTTLAYVQLLKGSTVKASTGCVTVEVLPDALDGKTVPESYDSAIQDAIDALDDAVEQLPATVEDVLADHPEWTTTVQDGSITEPKLATDLARDRERLLYRLDNLLTAQLPEGETATATDAARTPMAELALYGKSTQDGTPTPSAPVPIVSVGAENLVDYLTNYYAAAVSLVGGKLVNKATDSKTFATLIIQTMLNGTAQEAFYFSNQNVTDAGTYGRSFTTTKAFDTVRIKHNGNSGDVLFLQQGLSGKAGSDYYATITLDGTNPSVAGGLVACDIALYDGLRSRAYTPYGHAGLWAMGKNLLLCTSYSRFQLDNGITWTVNADGSVHAKGTSTSTSQVYWIVPKVDATRMGGMVLSGAPNVSGCSVRLEMRGAPYTAYAVDTTGAGATISLPSGGAADASLMCRVDSGRTVDVTFRPMVRQAGTDAAYQPYEQTVTPVPLDGHELRSLPDGTRDELTVDSRGHAVLVQRVGHVVLDGSESGWGQKATDTSGKYSCTFVCGLPDGTSLPVNVVSNWTLCDRFPNASDAGLNDGTYTCHTGVSARRTANGEVVFYHNGETLADFKTWLASNLTTLDYKLATPMTHDLGYVAAVPLVGPDLTAQAVPTAPMQLTYERDLNVTLARLESAIATLV